MSAKIITFPGSAFSNTARSANDLTEETLKDGLEKLRAEEIKKQISNEVDAMVKADPPPVEEPIKHFPLGTPEKTILDEMEKKAKFTFDISIKDALHGDAETRAKRDRERLDKKLENKNRW
jgi:hypothetical protein